jgi:hypothetical protein
MGDGRSDRIKANVAGEPTAWPPWVRGLVTCALVFQIAAVLGGALASPPSSPLERGLVQPFAIYHQLTDQGYAYRYYSPEPGPTPVATATIRYRDGRPDESVRIPERGLWPRMRYQRQLALANHLAADFEKARAATGDGGRSAWARSYARHIASSRPGCADVALFLQAHLIPDVERAADTWRSRRASPVDLDAEEFYTTPERIGEFSCDGL